MLPVWLESTYSRPQNWREGWGGFTPKIESNINETPKMHTLARVRVV